GIVARDVAARAECRGVLGERPREDWVALDGPGCGRAARQRFEPEAGRAGEKVDAARALHDRREPVENRLADAVGGRTQARAAREAETPPAPLAADDPHGARRSSLAHLVDRKSTRLNSSQVKISYY